MAAMKARRPGRGASEPQKRGRRGPPPPRGPVPRMAAIQGAFDGPAPETSLRGMAMGLVGAVLFAGAAIAGATWIGGSLFDAREAFASSADHLAARTGFALAEDSVEIKGVGGVRAAEVLAAINPDGRRSVLALDPIEVKERVERLDWVESARVRRLLPSRLEIEVDRRQAFALWREDGAISVIDLAGRPLRDERPTDNADLPIVEGAGAGAAASEILTALEEQPEVRDRTAVLTRIGDRRWNLQFVSGAVAMLPEAAGEMRTALATLSRQQAVNGLLDRPLEKIDLRVRGRLFASHGALAQGA